MTTPSERAKEQANAFFLQWGVLDDLPYLRVDQQEQAIPWLANILDTFAADAVWAEREGIVVALERIKNHRGYGTGTGWDNVLDLAIQIIRARTPASGEEAPRP